MARGHKVIVGLGETGLSYARFLAARGERFDVLEDRATPEKIAALAGIDATAEIHPLAADRLINAAEIYLSPGVPRRLDSLVAAADAAVRIRGDVEIFGDLANAPVVGITGTNGKSTVSDLVYSLASAQVEGACLAGNIGTPCLDVLSDDAALYVLELSSYQLELADALHTRVACVLNLSADHLDRYDSVADYFETKLALYRNTERAVVNRALGLDVDPFASFGTDSPAGDNAFGLASHGGRTWLMRGSEQLVAADELKLRGDHNLANVLAALAIGWALELDMAGMLKVARDYAGLPHRTQFVAEVNGIIFVNDSKATNPGAMAAAVRGLGGAGNVHLIAGGQTKGLSLAEAAENVSPYLHTVYVIGTEQDKVAADFAGMNVVRMASLDEAVMRAFDNADAGDVVLLAPGCASQDEFRDYRERGDVFSAAVGRLS